MNIFFAFILVSVCLIFYVDVFVVLRKFRRSNSVALRANEHRRIVVLIANYRDTKRCAETLESLFSKATHPHLITVSIFDQLHLKKGERRCFDAYCDLVGERCRRSERLRRNGTIDYHDATGPTFARYQTEEGIDLDVDTFAMAIDSHTVFIPHWDSDLVGQWDSIENPKAIITVYPDSLELYPKDGDTPTGVTLMCHARIENDAPDAMVQYSSAITIACPETPLLMSQYAGGFNFGTAVSALHVRNDPHTPFLFHGEEYSRVARLWTHGYDVYIPTHMVCYHWYEKRKAIWDKDWGAKMVIARRSFRRIRAALGLSASSDDFDRTDLAQFSIGTARTMAQFKEFSGIDPLAAWIEDNEHQFDVCPPHMMALVPVEEAKAAMPSLAPSAVMREKRLAKKKLALAQDTQALRRQREDRRTLVMIANFRDSKRCAETLDSLFSQAARPDLIQVSIFDQLHVKKEPPCFDAYCTLVGKRQCRRSERLRRNATIRYIDATGPTYARYQTEKGLDLDVDTFAMAVDSHTLFIPRWDADLIGQWDSIGNPNAIITVYPDDTDEYPEDGAPPTGVTLMCHARIEDDAPDAMVQYSSSITIPCPEKPLLMSQFAGGFNFGTAVSALEVRNDPYTPYLFHGEEYSRVARLWTHGYDVYIPTHMVCYHYYEDRKSMFDKDWETKEAIGRKSQRRIRAALGLPRTRDDFDKTELDKFSIGTKRTMAQFIAFTGIDPTAAWIKNNEHQFDVCPPKELKFVPF
ncbi:Aste57867_19645 [Aphanomyces stellatus]|uniref:Aste57867_19645 protein n=1 Tax=Aphanomyces stellatus TaxID=120398 RepID=A0A485LDK5_9STRA|nr:hypothetical protein As57867_019580 [Aphanomyces stellatus]VFT96345.1 Aste57867_19645 [Aphanomyces stellatus]